MCKLIEKITLGIHLEPVNPLLDLLRFVLLPVNGEAVPAPGFPVRYGPSRDGRAAAR